MGSQNLKISISVYRTLDLLYHDRKLLGDVGAHLPSNILSRADKITLVFHIVISKFQTEKKKKKKKNNQIVFVIVVSALF